MIKFLGISGTLFILSVCSGNSLFPTISLTLFVIAAVLNCIKLWRGKDIINLVVDATHDKSISCFKNKNYGKGLVYFMSYPMIVVGIFFAFLTLISMWAMVLK